jgi:hypothetical protein
VLRVARLLRVAVDPWVIEGLSRRTRCDGELGEAWAKVMLS